MELIDERGRLFGAVNVIDALVVLLVLAVVVAGVALVMGGDESSPTPDADGTTRAVTMTAGPVSPTVASLVDSGDRLELGGNATVTDVYRTPARNDPGVLVTVRIQATGDLTDGTFIVDGQPLRAGQSLTATSADYEFQGTVRTIGTGESLPVQNRSVTVETRLPATTAAALAADQRVRVAGQHVATVTSVASYPTTESDVRRVELGVRLRTLALAGGEEFGGRPVRLGATLPLRTDRYDLSGTVVNVGAAQPPGEQTTVTAEVVWENVDPDVADAVRVGAREESHGTTYVRVTARDVTPATVIVTSDDGEVYARDHPRLRDVSLRTTLTARRTDAGLRFHGRPLETGTTVVFDFGDVTVRGTVVELRR